jgi:hypothetical protein
MAGISAKVPLVTGQVRFPIIEPRKEILTPEMLSAG